MTNKNYYQLLGVAQDAEDFVIRAAYKVLAQRYHPDKYQGSKDEAASKMHLINEAYETLSDSQQRKIYDDELNNQSNNQSSKHNNDSNNLEDSDWEFIVQHYPDLNQITSMLEKFSPDLVIQYKLDLISSKRFEEREQIANQLGEKFLEDHFGTDKKILKFAFELISTGHKEAAQELNQAARLLGDSMDFDKVYIDIQKKYCPEMYKKFEREQAVATLAIQEAERRKEAYYEKQNKMWFFVFILSVLILFGFWVL